MDLWLIDCLSFYRRVIDVVNNMRFVDTVVHIVTIHINRLSHSIHIGKRTNIQLSMAEISLGKREIATLGDNGVLG